MICNTRVDIIIIQVMEIEVKYRRLIGEVCSDRKVKWVFLPLKIKRSV